MQIHLGSGFTGTVCSGVLACSLPCLSHIVACLQRLPQLLMSRWLLAAAVRTWQGKWRFETLVSSQVICQFLGFSSSNM